MQLTTSILLLAVGASTVSAAATPIHRRHQQFHQKKAVGDEVTAVIDGQTVHWINTYDGSTTSPDENGVSPAADATPVNPPAPAVTPPSPAQPNPTNTPDASTANAPAANSASLSSYKAFCSKKKRATNEEIAYKGDTGDCGYGSNFMLIDDSLANQYPYTIKFSGQHTEDQACVCWNKISEAGTIAGWFGNAPLSFSLPVGSSQTVAVDSNSQGGCSCGAGSVPKDSIGQWAGTWLEFDMANTSNGGYSGGDVSALVAQHAGMPVQGMQVCASGQCSSLTSGAAQNKAAYTQGMEADDGVGINLAPGNVAMNVVIGYSG